MGIIFIWSVVVVVADGTHMSNIGIDVNFHIGFHFYFCFRKILKIVIRKTSKDFIVSFIVVHVYIDLQSVLLTKSSCKSLYYIHFIYIFLCFFNFFPLLFVCRIAS